MNKAEYFLRKYSPTILTVVGAGGVVVTSVLAVKATPKAMMLLEEAKQEKGYDLTPVEVVKTAWKPYIPAVISGVSTIICIFGANHLNTRQQATLMSAYALLDNTYKEYQNKVNEVYGEDADTKVKHEMMSSRFDDYLEVEEGKMLFMEYSSMRIFESTMDEVLQAECEFREILQSRGYACLNEYLDILGLQHVAHGYQLGWMDLETNEPYNCEELEFTYEEGVMKNGQKYCMIIPNMPPALDYII